MTVTQWLWRGRNLLDEIDKLIDCRQSVLDMACKCTVSYNTNPASSSSDPHKFDALAALDDEIGRKINVYNRVISGIEKELNLLSNRKERDVLRLYYVDMMSWGEAAEKMGFSTRHIMNIKKQAIAHLEEQKKSKKGV